MKINGTRRYSISKSRLFEKATSDGIVIKRKILPNPTAISQENLTVDSGESIGMWVQIFE